MVFLKTIGLVKPLVGAHSASLRHPVDVVISGGDERLSKTHKTIVEARVDGGVPNVLRLGGGQGATSLFLWHGSLSGGTLRES